MPLEGSGLIHIAESAVGDPTSLIMKFLGADGTIEYTVTIIVSCTTETLLYCTSLQLLAVKYAH